MGDWRQEGKNNFGWPYGILGSGLEKTTHSKDVLSLASGLSKFDFVCNFLSLSYLIIVK